MSPTAQNVGESISHAGTAAVPAWKQELNERLAATRSRRLRRLPEQAALPGLEQIGLKDESKAARLAAKVAQRYANAPTYSEVLAAEVRARAHAAAFEKKASEPVIVVAQTTPVPPVIALRLDARESKDLGASLKVSAEDEKVAPDLEEEDQEEMIVEPLAVNLVAFPRELIAARKMRPRLAEGPLRDAGEEAQHDSSQSRNAAWPPAAISRGVSVGPAPANWSPILLDEDSLTPLTSGSALPVEQDPLKTATIEDRLMAAVFDLALVVAAFAVFVLVFVACTTHPPTGKPALVGAGLVLFGFGLLYQFLFFRYAEGTPGMRYAKIALCTFEDENPTRQAMCRRVLFLLLSAAPVGLGFLWACFDQDRLSWHDRISRMYQRSYS